MTGVGPRPVAVALPVTGLIVALWEIIGTYSSQLRTTRKCKMETKLKALTLRTSRIDAVVVARPLIGAIGPRQVVTDCAVAFANNMAVEKRGVHSFPMPGN